MWLLILATQEPLVCKYSIKVSKMKTFTQERNSPVTTRKSKNLANNLAYVFQMAGLLKVRVVSWL